MAYIDDEDGRPYIDVSSCTFYVKDADGKVLLETPDYKRAFAVKQFNPGSVVIVDAKIDATIEVSEKIIGGFDEA